MKGGARGFHQIFKGSLHPRAIKNKCWAWKGAEGLKKEIQREICFLLSRYPPGNVKGRLQEARRVMVSSKAQPHFKFLAIGVSLLPAGWGLTLPCARTCSSQGTRRYKVI